MNNTAYLIILAMLFGYGLFQLVGGIFDVPSHREIKTIMAVGKKKKEKVNFLDAFIFKVSHLILPYVRLNPYKRKKMSNALKSLGSLDTPEMVYGRAFVESGIYAGLGLILVFVHPIFTLILLFYAFWRFSDQIGKIDQLMRKRREKIEWELPRFVNTVQQEIKKRQDLLAILIDYRKNSDGELGEEVEITIADMKTSDYENAISRLDARVVSSLLSDVTQGLIAVIRGDDIVAYFEQLGIQLRSFEKNRLKKEMNRRLEKIKKYPYILLFTFLLMVVYAIGYDIMTTLPSIFG
ncbi:hypothetical protein [Acetobacterium malicum]|jgi:tight adherence protein C|uniref:Secretion protein F n=1 Tax=Acetobacterium malicum TaxID=52692 RepID=A0ABR6YX87_9FIRM|nr:MULTISPECIES: hypothetical protein [Acetobacterium]MBC3899740.1 hypothetical protein [Acetobacterium malicum]PKM48782.1 MAG: hypothetical protein CVV01_01755 [Firmicutes bacterium HGW-Firmicutes-6]PKM59513.1 MAG: hypothetical protein CVU99_12945 [Firmicutes bacterium HGW-Firmicutes-4]